MKKDTITFIIFVIALMLATSLQAGIFKMDYDAYFTQYLHRGEKATVVEIPLSSVTLGVSYLRRIRELDKPDSDKPFEGALEFMDATSSVQVTVLDVAFIEKIDGIDGKIFQPIDVHDYEMMNARKPKIYFLGDYRKLPVYWIKESGRYIYMDFPPIPEEIKEGEIFVKLKIKTPEGEQDFERRFPVYQKTYTGKYRIMD